MPGCAAASRSGRGLSVRAVEIKALSGARALPALLIVLFHYGVFHRSLPAGLWGQPIAKGYLWVDFFFALSGFLLIHVYGARSFGRHDYLAFVKARLARLYPLHLFTLLTMLGLMLAVNALAEAGGYVSLYRGYEAPLTTWSSFFANLFLVQAWNIVRGLGWNAPAWFVSVMFLLTLLFPVFLHLSRGGIGRGLGLIAAGAAWLILLAWPSGVGLDITFANGIFRGMAGFVLGAGMAVVFRAMAGREIAAWKLSAVQAALLLLLLWAVFFSGPDHSRADLLTAFAFDALILSLAFDRGFLARIFAHPALCKLGEWSYAIYMGQMFWLLLARHLEQRHLLTPGGQEALLLLVCCVVWGALLAVLVEHPANAWLRRQLTQKRASAVSLIP
jgi:peptidoglycan/LPS O-acetylase OafA/YrhL